MAKRKTVKPVKAWGLVKTNGEIECDTGWRKTFALSFVDPKGTYTRLVRVTVSVDDPKATRISAAQRRVVEAAKYCTFVSKHYGKSSHLMKLAVGVLIERVEALERAKGDRK